MVNKILGLKNGRRRGYNGNYKILPASDGSTSVFFEGGTHIEGLKIPEQTYVTGIWRPGRELAPISAPSVEGLDQKIAELRKKEQEQRQRLIELNKEHEEKLARYQRLVSNKTPAKLTIVSQTGDRTNPEELRTTVKFEELDENGYAIANKSHTATVIGQRLYFNALTVAFDDELIETGKVSGHPTLFRRLHGSAQAVVDGYQVNSFPKQPAATLSKQEESFLRKYTNTPKGEVPSWEGFWDFADSKDPNNAILKTYSENREDFWGEFFELGNQETFWNLANNSKMWKALGLRSVQGEGPVINVSEVAPGWSYTLSRRNLGSLEISFPNKNETPKPLG